MFSGLMMNTWIAASVVAVVAGMTGFFAVLRGSTFAAHAIPNGAFAGAAGAGLLGINVLWGLSVFAVGGALGIGALGRKARHDVVTALTLVLMLGLGALFVSVSSQYAEETYSLLFGEVFGVSRGEVLPIALLGAAAAAAIGLAFRPLMLTSALPEVADAGGVSTRGTEVYFLVVMALATSMTVPVVGALLMFSLMIGPAAAARAVTARPGAAMALSVAIALATVWLSIALSYRTNWPLGFFVGVAGAVFYLAAHVRGLSPAEPPGTAPTAQAGFAGYEWSVVAIGHDGKRTPIPARYSVYLQFAPDGRFGANDPVNYHFGSYRRTGDGFTIGDIASSLVGYAGADPVTLLAIGAISAFGKGAHATATVAGDRLTVTAGGYTLTCRRDGAQADFPPPTPT